MYIPKTQNFSRFSHPLSDADGFILAYGNNIIEFSNPAGIDCYVIGIAAAERTAGFTAVIDPLTTAQVYQFRPVFTDQCSTARRAPRTGSLGRQLPVGVAHCTVGHICYAVHGTVKLLALAHQHRNNSNQSSNSRNN